MAVIRLILLVAVLGGLTLLLVQNFSPALSLVFLGVRTQPLPLAIWILFSTATGAFTSILIATLFNLSNYFVAGQRQTPERRGTTSARAKATQREEFTSRPATPPPASKKEEPTSSEVFDDWETNGNRDDDWNFDEKSEETPKPNPQAQPARDSKIYERQSETKSGSQSGSVYSYSYREPKNTAAGKTESVYDADYRVIIPPYQPPTTNQADDDDWEFFDDDEDFEDDDKRSRR
ncbi:MAG: LapA family protein [Nostoc sp. DedVER02]|uniref:LapA family protein n=1 Tax=unclassified Nostoc TaxID=2593658 RepID=UPI002AD5914F|nr:MULTISPECIES: LapA family protein [unclassified Nostoc]MDZ7984375.1 LapA family protein [Nostoc sp. DedVER02]MDZ8111422.1 LapA family protein [Nostoc sp. DedVER01b]